MKTEEVKIKKSRQNDNPFPTGGHPSPSQNYIVLVQR